MHDNKVNANKITRSNTYLFDCGSIYTLSARNPTRNLPVLSGSHHTQSLLFVKRSDALTAAFIPRGLLNCESMF